jgi:hypothetical protein
MIRIAEFVVGLMALDARARRAVDASFADWRHEVACTSTPVRTLLINIRSAVGVLRTLAIAGWSELRSGSMIPFAWRLSAIVGLWVVWMLKDGPPGTTDRFFLVTSQAKASTLVAAVLIPKLAAVFPLMVFLAEALGRRRRVTPIAGTSVLLASLVVLFGFVLLPSSLTYSSYETWRYFANASVAEPHVTRRLLSAFTVLTAIATGFSVAGVCLLFLFANRVRRVGGFTGWGIGLGTIFLVYLAGLVIGMPLLPIYARILMLTWPFVMYAAILWATHRLSRIEAARI